MAQKIICSIPFAWDLVEYRKHTCSDSSHTHFSFADIRKLEKRGLVTWLLHPDKPNDVKAVCYIADHVAEIDKIFDQSSFGIGSPVNSGLSFRVGPYHARAILRGKPWAHVMLSEINRTHLTSVEPIPEELPIPYEPPEKPKSDLSNFG